MKWRLVSFINMITRKNGLYVVTQTSTSRHQRLRHNVARMLFGQTRSVCRDLSSYALMTCALLPMNIKNLGSAAAILAEVDSTWSGHVLLYECKCFTKKIDKSKSWEESLRILHESLVTCWHFKQTLNPAVFPSAILQLSSQFWTPRRWEPGGSTVLYTCKIISNRLFLQDKIYRKSNLA